MPLQNLKDFFTNVGLERTTRESAGDLLLHLVSDEKLRDAILSDEVATCCQHEAVRAMSNEAGVDPYFVSIYVQLLSVAMWHQSENLIKSQVSSFFLPLTPLLYHPYAQIRQAVALLILPFLFKEIRLIIDDSGLPIFQVPSAFAAAFAFPTNSLKLKGPGYDMEGAEDALKQTLQFILEKNRLIQNGTDNAIATISESVRATSSLSVEVASAGSRMRATWWRQLQGEAPRGRPWMPEIMTRLGLCGA